MAVAEELTVIIEAKVDNALKNLKSVDTQTGKTEKGFTKFTKFLSSSGIGAFLAVGSAVAMTTKYLKESEEAARNAEEVYAKYATVFETIGADAEASAERFADSFGLAESTAKQLLGTTGDLLVGMGATETQSLALSEKVNTLAADLASFSNIEGGTERASHALTAALLGEREQAKMLGLVIREADVQQKLLERGQQDLTGQAKLLATAEVTLALATEQSGKAIGDYARTSESAANVQKRMVEASKELKEAIGKSVVEAVTPLRRAWSNVADQLADVIKKQNELRDANKAVEEGNATYAQRILLLDKEREGLQNTFNFQTGIRGVSQADIDAINKKTQDRITTIDLELYALGRLATQEELAAAAAAKAAQAVEEEATAKAAAAAEQKQDLDNLNAAWADTDAGQLAALESLIAYYESFIQTEKVRAVLEDLRDKLNSLTSSYTDLGIAHETYFDTFADMLSAEQAIADWEAEEQQNKLERLAELKEVQKEVANSMVTLALGVATAWADTYAANNEESKRAARIQAAVAKASALYQIGVSTFEAATKALTLGPIAGPIAAAIITGLGVANAAAVLAEPLPALAEGGIVTSPTTALIGEAGPEAVIPLDKGGFGTTVVINNYATILSEDNFEQKVVRAVMNAQRGY